MSVRDVHDVIRRQYRDFDAEQAAITWQEILDALETDQRPDAPVEVADPTRVGAPRSARGVNRRGLAVAAGTAVLVLVAGVVPFILMGGEPPAADSSASTTLADAPATVTTEAPTTTEPTLVTDPTDTSGVFGFPPGVPIRDKYGFDITDTLISIAEYRDAIEGGAPAPLFDTAALGVEEILTPTESWLAEGGSTPSPNSDGATQQLILWTVSLEGTDVLGQFGAFLGLPADTETSDFDANIEFGFNVSPGLSQGRDALLPPDSLGLLLVSDSGRGFATGIAGLPTQAAVVTAEYGDGTRVWQRPLFGMALFSNTTRVCQVEPVEGQGCAPMEISILDQSGAELFTIRTPASESAHESMITMPNGETYIRH